MDITDNSELVFEQAMAKSYEEYRKAIEPELRAEAEAAAEFERWIDKRAAEIRAEGFEFDEYEFIDANAPRHDERRS